MCSFARYILSQKPDRGLLARARHLLTKQTFERVLRDLVTERNQRYGGWSKNVLTWTKFRNDARTATITFESLIEDPISNVAYALKRVEHDQHC